MMRTQSIKIFVIIGAIVLLAACGPKIEEPALDQSVSSVKKDDSAEPFNDAIDETKISDVVPAIPVPLPALDEPLPNWFGMNTIGIGGQGEVTSRDENHD